MSGKCWIGVKLMVAWEQAQRVAARFDMELAWREYTRVLGDYRAHNHGCREGCHRLETEGTVVPHKEKEE